MTKKLCNGEKEAKILNKSSLTCTGKFRVKTFYVIIDKLLTELTKRSDGYEQITRLFGFLQSVLTISTDKMATTAKNLVEVYSQVLEDRLLYELKQFVLLLKLHSEEFFSNRQKKNNRINILCPLIILNWIADRNMIDVKGWYSIPTSTAFSIVYGPIRVRRVKIGVLLL